MKIANWWVLSVAALAAIILLSAATVPLMPGCDAPLVGGHTGAPGESGCGGCHAGAVNSGPGTLSFDIGTSSYVPGETYTASVRLVQAGMAKFGFSILALTDNESPSGSFQLFETVRTRTYTDGPRKYASHTPCGADSSNANSWRIKWVAPPANIGTITFYLGALAANHDHATSGDYNYFAKLSLQPVEATGTTQESYSNGAKLKVATERLYVSLSGEEKVFVSVYDICGRSVCRVQSDGSSELEISTTSWPKGIYVVHIERKHMNSVNKVIIP